MLLVILYMKIVDLRHYYSQKYVNYQRVQLDRFNQ